MKSYFNGVMAFILQFYKKVSITDVFLGIFRDLKKAIFIKTQVTFFTIYKILYSAISSGIIRQIFYHF